MKSGLIVLGVLVLALGLVYGVGEAVSNPFQEVVPPTVP